MIKLDGLRQAPRRPALRRPAPARGARPRARHAGPKVLLLDEPLGALDKRLRESMQIELRQLQKSVGITFVFVTHDQEEALSMSDRIAVMSAGKVLADRRTARALRGAQLPRGRRFHRHHEFLRRDCRRAQRRYRRRWMPARSAKSRRSRPIRRAPQVLIAVRPEKITLSADARSGGSEGHNRGVCLSRRAQPHQRDGGWHRRTGLGGRAKSRPRWCASSRRRHRLSFLGSRGDGDPAAGLEEVVITSIRWRHPEAAPRSRASKDDIATVCASAFAKATADKMYKTRPPKL